MKFATDILSFKLLVAAYLVLALPWVFTTQNAVRKLFGGSLLAVLGTFRGLVLLLVLSTLFGLTLILPRGTGSKKLVILEDHSLSMSLPDSSGSVMSRAKRADSAVTRFISGLEDDWKTVKLPFGETVQREGDSAGERDLAGGTDIIHSVLEAVSSFGEGGGNPIVVVSDGRVTTGPVHVRAMAGKETPVFGLLVGSDPGTFDASIVSLNNPEPVFQGEEVPLRILVSGFGPDGSGVGVTVKVDQKVTDKRTIDLEGGGTKMEFESILPAMRPGMHLVEVHLESAGPEYTTLNNSRRLYLNVEKSKQQVFLYSNSPDWDFTFLKRFVESFPDYEAITVIEPVYGRQVGLEGAGRFSLPGRAGENIRHSVETSNIVVLHGDIALVPRAVRESVSAGLKKGDVGVLLLPSVPWNSAGSWGEIAALCPFPGGVEKVSRTGSVRASGALSSHPVLSIGIGPDFGDREELSPLRYVLSGVGPVSGFVSILNTVLAGDVEVPVVVMTEPVSGGSRGLILLGGGFWQWDMFPLQFGRGPYFRNLCQGFIEWLAEPSLRKGSFCEPLSHSVRRGEGVVFRRSPGTDRNILLELEPDNGEVSDTTYSYVIETGKSPDSEEIFLPPGIYRYRAREEGAYGDTPTSEGTILVDASSREFDDPRPDPGFMGSLSKVTGGRVFGADRVDSLVAAVTAVGGRKGRTLRFEMKKEPTVYIVLLLMFFVELVMRRRKGLP